MLNILAKLFKKTEKKSPGNAASDYWDGWQKEVDAEQPRWVDWGEHPAFLALIYREIFGSEEVTLFHHLKQQYPAFGSQACISLCSGDGGFERLLVDHGIFASVTGMDISPARVKRALETHAARGEKLKFLISDMNHGDYGSNAYDVVFAKAALHHIADLESAFKGMATCLRPGGHLVTVDFFGPSRFQWSDSQIELANQLLQQIPENLRTTRKGEIKTIVRRPTVEEMIAADPSEAARSEEVKSFIDENFLILEEHDIGGTLFNLVFTPDIIDNFDPDNAAHRQTIEDVFSSERALIRSGQLPSDFKFIVARKK